MFKLNIESSKDIDELHIVFSDGTSNIVCNSKFNDTNNINNSISNKSIKNISKSKSREPKETKPKKPDVVSDFNFDDYLDTEIDKTPLEVVNKPNINLGSRPVKVDDNLQNFDL